MAHIHLHDELDDLGRAVEVAEGVPYQPKGTLGHIEGNLG